MHLQFFFVGFFVDPGPLSPDPTLAGKKEILTQINILNVDFLFFSLYTTVIVDIQLFFHIQWACPVM